MLNKGAYIQILVSLNSVNKRIEQLPYLSAIIILSIVFLAVPIYQMHGLIMMPGNIGDARLNNYFLENVYTFFSGYSDSLWHLGFFSPYPFVLGFSDNLFGTSPIYMFARLITGQADTAYQIWFLVGYIVNYFSAFYSFRRFGGSCLASSAGALIFAFSLPTTAHAGHAQLHYRFGLPLAITFMTLFLGSKEYRFLSIAGLWTVWQFYCGIYMGFFTLLLLVASVAVYSIYRYYTSNTSLIRLIYEFLGEWFKQSSNDKLKSISYMLALLLLLLVLFYPYLEVSHLYSAKRSWNEILLMLPRPQSYLLSDASYFWSSPNSNLFSRLPMRHEHQMFIGAIPMVLAICGYFVGSKGKNEYIFVLMKGILFLAIIVTLCVYETSLWYVFHMLPLASAIRAMTRLDQALLFPIAYLALLGIDELRSKWQWFTTVFVLFVLPLMIIEFSATSMPISLKEEWRNRIEMKESTIPKQLSEDSILFFAQNERPFFADELDAMWVSLIHGKHTLNGYSGLGPPGYSAEYGSDCSELPKRIFSFLAFKGLDDNREAFYALMRRIVPIGFSNCDPNWIANPPKVTRTSRIYSATEVSNLSYRFERAETNNGKRVIYIAILNTGDIPISAQSAIGMPVRLSWRFLDSSGQPVSGWDLRKDLPFDIPAKGDLTVLIEIDPSLEIRGGTLQVSMVQELVFWAHDIGVKPLEIPWR
jgi:hypothetical protein